MMISTVAQHCHFGTPRRGEAAARITCTAYVDGRTRENSSFRKNVSLVAEVVGDREGKISRGKVDGHVQNL